jgi:hypothetical protein
MLNLDPPPAPIITDSGPVPSGEPARAIRPERSELREDQIVAELKPTGPGTNVDCLEPVCAKDVSSSLVDVSDIDGNYVIIFAVNFQRGFFGLIEKGNLFSFWK